MAAYRAKEVDAKEIQMHVPPQSPVASQTLAASLAAPQTPVALQACVPQTSLKSGVGEGVATMAQKGHGAVTSTTTADTTASTNSEGEGGSGSLANINNTRTGDAGGVEEPPATAQQNSCSDSDGDGGDSDATLRDDGDDTESDEERSSSLAHVLGKRVQVWWDGEGLWFDATVRETRSAMSDDGRGYTEHLVVYDDGHEIWEPLLPPQRWRFTKQLEEQLLEEQQQKEQQQKEQQRKEQQQKEQASAVDPAAAASAAVASAASAVSAQPVSRNPRRTHGASAPRSRIMVPLATPRQGNVVWDVTSQKWHVYVIPMHHPLTHAPPTRTSSRPSTHSPTHPTMSLLL
jgi:hypothetical protein